MRHVSTRSDQEEGEREAALEGASSIRHCVAVYGEGVVAKENKMLEELLFPHFWCLMRL